jgi:hypothetical protein
MVMIDPFAASAGADWRVIEALTGWMKATNLMKD